MKEKFGLYHFISKAKKTHGDRYDYSSAVYRGLNNKIDIICPKHGLFLQRAQSHINGQGCKYCRFENYSKIKTSTTIDFVRKAKNIHEEKYDYSRVKYKHSMIPIEIICRTHGIFLQNPNCHLKGRGCPRCNKSKGENRIYNFLMSNKIKFESQKRFEICKNKKPLPFDFFIPSKNFLIEFDGEQHFNSNIKFGNNYSFKKRKINDSIKNDFASKSGISLLRISYKNIKNIEIILQDKLLK